MRQDYQTSLEEALAKSLLSKAYAFLDPSKDIKAEKQGCWIKILELNHRDSCVRYHGFSKIDDVPVRFRNLMWCPVTPENALVHLASISP